MEDNVKKGPSALVLPMILFLVLIIFVVVLLKSCGGYFKSSENVSHNQAGYSFATGSPDASSEAVTAKDTVATAKDSTAATAPADSTAH